MNKDQEKILSRLNKKDQAVYRLLQQDHSQADIARLWGVTRQCICTRVNRIRARGIPIEMKKFVSRGRPRPWTEEDDAQLIRLYNQRMMIKDIAPQLDRTVVAIYNRIDILFKQGHLTQTQYNMNLSDAIRMREEGLVDQEIADKLGKSRSWVRHAFKRLRRLGHDIPSPYKGRPKGRTA